MWGTRRHACVGPVLWLWLWLWLWLCGCRFFIVLPTS